MHLRMRYIVAKFIVIFVILALITFTQYHSSYESFMDGNQIEHLKYEVIHVGVVRTGYSSSLPFYTMLKSLYFYRSNPLHFHIIADEISEEIIKNLFETWAVPQVNVSFYNTKTLIIDMSWIPKCKGNSEILKLAFPRAVPTDVASKIIIIDANLTFFSNIYGLWNTFDSFNENQAVGLVENQSHDWLEINKQRLTPAGKKRIFSSDVILYHLKRLKTGGWTKMWLKTINHLLSNFEKTGPINQDIISVFFAKYLDLIYYVPYYWNSDSTKTCTFNNKYENMGSSAKLNPQKIQYDNDYGKMRNIILDCDGNLLRQRLYGCGESSKDVFTAELLSNSCSDIYEAESHQWRTLLLFRKFEHNVTENDLTFVSQLSHDRLHILQQLGALWDGPMSVTIYATDSELYQSVNFIEHSTVLQNRFNIAYHLVFKEGDDYPINVLRDVALHQVITPYVFLVDIDFLPMPNLYPILREQIGNMGNMDRKALVVPAFETKNYLPRTKHELLKMLDNHTLFTFHQKVCHPAHAPTNYAKWRTANESYEVKWREGFEPYIIVQRNVTEYDRRFLGYGWNKVSHIMTLKAQGYQFIVLPNVFIVHKSHKWSQDRRKFLSSVRQKYMLHLKRKFIRELRQKYGYKS